MCKCAKSTIFFQVFSSLKKLTHQKVCSHAKQPEHSHRLATPFCTFEHLNIINIVVFLRNSKSYCNFAAKKTTNNEEIPTVNHSQEDHHVPTSPLYVATCSRYPVPNGSRNTNHHGNCWTAILR